MLLPCVIKKTHSQLSDNFLLVRASTFQIGWLKLCHLSSGVLFRIQYNHFMCIYKVRSRTTADRNVIVPSLCLDLFVVSGYLFRETDSFMAIRLTHLRLPWYLVLHQISMEHIFFFF